MCNQGESEPLLDANLEMIAHHLTKLRILYSSELLTCLMNGFERKYDGL